MKILIVDDEASNLSALMSILKAKGHEPIDAYNGEQAVNYLQETSDVDVVITDLQMTGIDGIEVIRKAKQLYPKIRAFLISGRLSEYSKKAAMESGAEKTFHKPFGIRGLQEAGLIT